MEPVQVITVKFMIRPYDYAAAILFAYGLYGMLFFPFFGFVMAWVAYEVGWNNGYCQWRKDME